MKTASEFLKQRYQNDNASFSDNVEALQAFAKMHVNAALKAAVEKAEIIDYDVHEQYSPSLDEKSILTAYPTNNIK
jgi:hypothetical protein